MTSKLNLAFLVLFSFQSYAQLASADSLAKEGFLKKLKQINQTFNTYFNSHMEKLYGADEKIFIDKIDSLRNNFLLPLGKLRTAHPQIGHAFFEELYTDLNFTFNKFILDYAPIHKRITGKEARLSSITKERLKEVNISNPDLLQYDAYRKYLQSVLEQALEAELRKNKSKYQNSTNQRLDAGMACLATVFNNTDVRNRMRYELLNDHIENYGVKNIGYHIQTFNSNNRDKVLGEKIDSLYRDGLEGRKGHLIETYKTIGNTSLDLHIFRPEGNRDKHPAIVLFHGGGWSEGMPDWFFYSCEAYAKKGWVAVAVEYRLRNRHGTLPPAAIEDGKSAIRYLRLNAARLQIDTNKIIAAGNSAGANLALALALIDTLDRKNENPMISSVPNAVMLNSVATDLTKGDFWQQYFADKHFLQRISPLHQVRKHLPPILIVQGSKDHTVPLQPVINFSEKMRAIGNDCELHVLEGAGHYIWLDRRFSNQVNEYRASFLKKHGYGTD